MKELNWLKIVLVGGIVVLVVAIGWVALNKPVTETEPLQPHTVLVDSQGNRKSTEETSVNDIDVDMSRPIEDLVAEALALMETDMEKAIAMINKVLAKLRPENLEKIVAMIEEAIPKDQGHVAFYEALLKHWAVFDGESSVGYAMNNLEDVVRLNAGTAAMKSWAARDLQNAANYVRDLPEAYGKDYLLYGLPYLYSDQDPVAGMEWVRTIEGDYLRKTAGLHMMIGWLAKSPEQALDWTLKNADPEKEPVLIQEATTHLAREDLKKADEWTSKLASDKAKEVAMITIVNFLATERPDEVGKWLNQFKSGFAMDRVFKTYAEVVSHMDPETARSWAQDIMDERLRAQTLQIIERNEQGLASEQGSPIESP